ncbi:glycosyltransferase family 39 protein [Maribacter sp. TH_r10]|nr:glycosyltransferase family 39 protein [Maribacter sp. TH_r10]
MALGKNSINRIEILSFLSFFAITGITFFKSALELEDAEQAYYSQWLRWGYDDQPPLYTWLQYGVNQIFGSHKISFSLLRGVIFACILLLVWQFARKVIKDSKKSELVVFGLVLIPVFIDFTFRRLSHTSLLCGAVVVSYLVLQQLVHYKTWKNYALLGLVVGIGILSKYNYVLFLAALGATLFFDESLRKVVSSKKMVLAFLIVLALTLPHFYWLLGPGGYASELGESVSIKTQNESGEGIFIIGPLFSLLLNLLRLIAPLMAVFILTFSLKKIRFRRPELDCLAKMALAQLAVLVLFFVVLNVQKVEERWLLPLVLPFMVLLMRSVEFKSVTKWSSYGFVLFLIVVGFQVLRTPVEKVMGIPSSVHFGFEPLNDVLEKKYDDKIWMLPDVTYAGNVKLLNPEKEVFAKDDFSLPISKLLNIEGVEVMLKRDVTGNEKVLDSILNFGKERDTLFIVKFDGNLYTP